MVRRQYSSGFVAKTFFCNNVHMKKSVQQKSLYIRNVLYVSLTQSKCVINRLCFDLKLVGMAKFLRFKQNSSFVVYLCEILPEEVQYKALYTRNVLYVSLTQSKCVIYRLCFDLKLVGMAKFLRFKQNSSFVVYLCEILPEEVQYKALYIRNVLYVSLTQSKCVG